MFPIPKFFRVFTCLSFSKSDWTRFMSFLPLEDTSYFLQLLRGREENRLGLFPEKSIYQQDIGNFSLLSNYILQKYPRPKLNLLCWVMTIIFAVSNFTYNLPSKSITTSCWLWIFLFFFWIFYAPTGGCHIGLTTTERRVTEDEVPFVLHPEFSYCSSFVLKTFPLVCSLSKLPSFLKVNFLPFGKDVTVTHFETLFVYLIKTNEKYLFEGRRATFLKWLLSLSPGSEQESHFPKGIKKCRSNYLINFTITFHFGFWRRMHGLGAMKEYI